MTAASSSSRSIRALPESPRYERKFVADGVTLAEALAAVRQHPAAFHEVYPARSVNNVYLDTPELRDFHDHISGIAHRSKTRIRWYGPWSGSIDAPTLERKYKQGHISGKASHGLPSFSMKGYVSRAALEAAFDGAQMRPLARSALQHLCPSLLNRYQRRYFQSADRRFRLTVDSHLQFASAREAAGSKVSFSHPSGLVVIELKFGLPEVEAAAAVTNSLPFRLARCSKYVLGISRLVGL
jgi:hypothetical protein